MCIILLAREAHPDYSLILAANRDEFYERPTARASFWEDDGDVLAGRDLERGGTWLGVTRRGRFAAVTNYREPLVKIKDAPSRGLLVSRFLAGSDGPQDYLQELSASARLYNGFNLVVGTPSSLFYFSNRGGPPTEIPSGVHGLSNHLLNTPWPKVERGQSALRRVVEDRDFSVEEIFEVLADDARAEDLALPQTGVTLEMERLLSPLFIKTPVYGTRSSTVLLINRRQEVVFVERTFTAEGYEDSRYEFKIKE
jgi:uncharacterized protein with NRDE domain